MRRTRLLAGPFALLLALAACGDEQDASPAPGTTTTTGGTEASTAVTPTGGAEDTTSETRASTVEPTEGTTSAQGGRCLSPLGYSVVVPSGWVTNTGDVAPPCSYLDPEPFTVPAATDVRPAAISLAVDPVPFDDVSAERAPQTQREETTLGGLDAVRVEAVDDGSGLYPEGTQRTAWYVDLPPAPGDDGPRTLVADVVATPGGDVDLEEVATVLDRTMATLQLETASATTS